MTSPPDFSAPTTTARPPQNRSSRDHRPEAPPDNDRLWLHALLFVVTFASMVFAGQSLIARDLAYAEGGWVAAVLDGLLYAVPFILFLTVHEFGHYIAARRVGIRVSLPYYLPIPLPGSFGTFGAVIRIREPIRRTRQLFDIGASGPLAGFTIALITLVVALLTLPAPNYLLTISGHVPIVEEILRTGHFPPIEVGVPEGALAIVFGETPLFHLITLLAPYEVASYELVHYPLLLAGWLGLFFTALNLLPVGQLDGGHVIYALFGPKVHRVVARVTTLLLLLSGVIGLVMDLGPALTLPETIPLGTHVEWALAPLLLVGALWKIFEDWRLASAGTVLLLALVAGTVALFPALAASVGYWGWLLWIGLILFLIRVDHPPVLVHEPLTPTRQVLGYLCIAIFLLCFSIQPISIIQPT